MSRSGVEMALTPPADLAIFDLDGVIVDSRQAVQTAVNRTLVDRGFAPRPPAELDRFIGPPVLGAFAELTGHAAGSPLVAACAETYHGHYAAVYLEQTTLVPDIHAVLGRLSLPLALATAKPVDFVAPLLERLGIAGRFRLTSAPAMSALDEPKAMIVARVLRALGATAAVVIGDRSFDVEAAHANGVRAIGVTWGIGDRAELAGAGAETIIDRPPQLLGLLAARAD